MEGQAEPRKADPPQAGRSYMQMDLTAADVSSDDIKGASGRFEVRIDGVTFGRVRYQVFWKPCGSKPGVQPIMVVMDMDNTVKVIDAIEKAIELVNRAILNGNNSWTLLHQNSSAFEFRLANKKGEPKMDYPGSLM